MAPSGSTISKSPSMRMGPFFRMVTFAGIGEMVAEQRRYTGVMKSWFPLLFCVSAVLAAAADLAPEVVLLQRARNIMAENLARLPNYTCLQTIERFERMAPKGKPRLLDIVRIEVAFVDGRELFSWPGSGRFLDTAIGDLVKGGAIGNGTFALHAKAVFQTSTPRFTYAGKSEWQGRLTHIWKFVVPQMSSGYTLRVGTREAIVGYWGSIRVDAASLDLLRLEVEAQDVPPALELQTARDAVEYVRSNIGGEAFLLPSFAELEMVALNGASNRNRTRFSSCHQYSGESRLIFDDPDPATPVAAEPVRFLQGPPKLRIELELQSDLQLENAAIGDPVTAVLRKPVEIGAGITIARGALVHGRLAMKRQAWFGRYAGNILGIQFDQIDDRNTRVEISATLEEIQTVRPGIRTPRDFWSGGRNRADGNRDQAPGAFFADANVRLLPRGLRMIYRTNEPRSAEIQ